MEFFATCGAGLEPILGTELRELGLDEVRPLTGGVSFSSDVDGAYVALLWSRVASRILMVVERIAAADSDELYDAVRGIPWEDIVASGATIAITARGTNDELRDTRFTALRVKDAICDRMREVTGQRPDVDAQNPDLHVQVNLRGKKATVYLDLSGTSLEDRGYRHAARSASSTIHETLAAAMLLAADWPTRARNGGLFVDGSCGAGTLAIEAAMIAADIAPGLMRSRWGFAGWKGHDPALWDRLLDEADARAQDAPRKTAVLLSDASPDELACAQARAKSAGASALIEAFEDSSSLFKVLGKRKGAHALYGTAHLVVSDSSLATLPARCARLASTLLVHEQVDVAALLVDGVETDAFLGLERTQGFACRHGSSPCDIALYDLRAESAMKAQVTVRGKIIAVYDAAAQQFADRFNKMCKQRQKWASKNGIFAYRVYDADLPDYNMAIDVYEGAGPCAGERYVHVAEYAPPKSIDALKAARRMTDALNIVDCVLAVEPDCVFVKRRMRARGGSQYVDAGAKSQQGDATSQGRIVTQENGLLFEVDLASYLDTGLFLDHRETRELVGRLAESKSFLNLFAYTCTASVYAAARGAKFTTSVDLSNTYLRWGEQNMKLNGLLNDHQEFVRADCLEWVNQTRHSRLRWDIVFVDPPTFSNSAKMRKGAWDVQRDHAELLIGVSRLLTRGGAAVFSCNLRGFKLDYEKLQKAGVQVVDITDKTIPLDFERHVNIHHCFILRRI